MTAWMVVLIVLIAGCSGSNSAKPSDAASPGNGNKTSPKRGEQPIQPVSSDHEPIPLDRLIGMAQLIVVGEVFEVRDTTYKLHVKLQLVGDASSEIEVLQFIPDRFEGAPRPAPYRTGQAFLLFLIKDEKHQMQKYWKILGAGGEGEMPVQDGFVYFHGRNVEGIPFKSYRIHGVERNIQRLEAQVFFDAVKKHRSCFEWKPGKGDRLEPARICDEATIDQYARVSNIHRYLVKLTLDSIRSR